MSSLYDQVELAQASTRVKRRLKIINPAASNNVTALSLKPSLSPNKHLPSILEAQEEKVFGRPTKPCDNINEVMQYSHLNDYLRQKLRDTKFNLTERSSITKNLHTAIAASHTNKLQ